MAEQLPPCCTLFAVVRGDGELVRGCKAAVSVRLNVGRYRVTFAQDVTACAYVATLGLPNFPGGGFVPPMGEIFVSPGNNANQVLVWTSNSMGVFADRPFHLAVHCCCCPDQDPDED